MVYTLLDFMYLGMCCTESYQQLAVVQVCEKFVRNLSCGLTIYFVSVTCTLASFFWPGNEATYMSASPHSFISDCLTNFDFYVLVIA